MKPFSGRARRAALLTVIYALGVIGIVASGGGGGGDGGTPAPTVTASFTVSPASGPAPLTVSFNASASSTTAGTITSYEWQFGDGSEENISAPTTTHRYVNSATYLVQLTVRTSGNQSATTTRSVTVTAPQQAVWLGGYQSDLYPDSALRAELTRSGNTISGTYEDDGGRTGTIELTIDGMNVTAQIIETTPGCSGLFTGGGGYDPSEGAAVVFIAFTGVNCDGEHAAGELGLIEQLADVLAWGRPGIGDIRHAGDELYFTDGSEFPLSKVDLTSGVVTPLAYAMRAVPGMTLAGDHLLWTDFLADFGETGCAGLGVVRALVVANADGSDPHRVAAGDTCGPPAQEYPLSDGVYAYWIRVDATGPFIERVPLIGGAAERIAPIGDTSWTTFALDATDIYWTESLGAGVPSLIRRCPLAGCGLGSPTVVSTGDNYSFEGGIVVDDTYVYAGLRREGSFAPAIARVPKSGGTLTDIIADASARGLTSDGTDFFWFDDAGGNFSQIETAPITGGTPVALASDIFLMRGLAISPTHVYWIEATSGTNANDGKIRRVPKSGGAIEDLKTDAVWPEHIQVEPQTGAVIYADGGQDENREQGIRRVSLAGVTTTIARGIPPSQPLAVDATGVYVGAGFSIAKLGRTGLGVAATFSQLSDGVSKIEADGSNVYVLTSDPFGTVIAIPTTGVPTKTVLGSANGFTTQLRQNTNDVFVNSLSSGSVLRFPKTGGLTDALADSLAFPYEFVVDDSYAYVVESDARSISRIDLGTKAQTTFASTPLFTGWWAMTHDASAVYLMDYGAIRRYSKPTGAETMPYGPVFHDPFVDRASIAVDGSSLYWTETLLGAVKRAPK